MMLLPFVLSIFAFAKCDAFTFSRSNRHTAHRTAPTLFPLSSHSGKHLLDDLSSESESSGATENQHKRSQEIWELGLRMSSNPELPLEHTSRCINQVVGVSEAESHEIVSQAHRHGIALIEELPLDVAVSFKAELERCGIYCEMVPAEKPLSQDSIEGDMWELGLLRDEHYSREYTSRCLCQVAGLSEADAYEASSQASRHGVALIDKFHSEHAEHFMSELTRLGIDVCVVSAGEE